MALDKNDMLRLLIAERGPIIGFIQSIARDRELGEDVFQDLVVLTSEKTPSIESRAHFLSWARTSARFMVNNAVRKRSRLVPLDEAVLDLLESHWAVLDEHSGAVLADALEDCLRSLTANARKLLRLRYDEGLSGDRLADALGRKLNTVHVALSRVYKFLAECIEARLAAEGEGHA